MKSSRCTSFGAIFVVSVLLGGCGGSESPTSARSIMPQTSSLAMSAARERSWMLPEAHSEDLLYVSAYVAYQESDVYVYDYKTGKQVGLLTGFDAPHGQCVDKKGDVWIANTGGLPSLNTRTVDRPHLQRWRLMVRLGAARSIQLPETSPLRPGPMGMVLAT